MVEPTIITCKNCKGGNCGEKASCVAQIRNVVENGGIAFMIYTVHVIERIKRLNLEYEIKIRYGGVNNDIPVGMWIFSKRFFKAD